MVEYTFKYRHIFIQLKKIKITEIFRTPVKVIDFYANSEIGICKFQSD